MKTKKSYGIENDLNLKALIALARCAQSVNKREFRTIREGGLTVGQFVVLEVLYHKGDLRICEIIEKTNSTGGNMTVVIDNLKKDGLVDRYTDPADGRASVIRITDKGKQLMETVFPEHVMNISEIFGVLSLEEKQQLIQLLKKLSGVAE